MNVYEEIVKLQREGRSGAVATIVNSRGSIPSFQSAKMLIRDDGSIAGTIGGGCVEAEVWQAAREVIAQEKPRTLTFDLNQDPKYDTGLVCGGTLEIFIEPVLPVPLLYIFGAGHVAIELFKAARNAGFDCIVTDDREAYANAERFPNALQIIAKDFDEALKELAPGESSYIVIATRGHRDDMRVLRWAVQTPARYIGMVGSKRKAITVFRELTREGLNPELFDRVHSPVGLDIGAVTPEEIAVSIVAELIASAPPRGTRLASHELVPQRQARRGRRQNRRARRTPFRARGKVALSPKRALLSSQYDRCPESLRPHSRCRRVFAHGLGQGDASLASARAGRQPPARSDAALRGHPRVRALHKLGRCRGWDKLPSDRCYRRSIWRLHGPQSKPRTRPIQFPEGRLARSFIPRLRFRNDYACRLPSIKNQLA